MFFKSIMLYTINTCVYVYIKNLDRGTFKFKLKLKIEEASCFSVFNFSAQKAVSKYLFILTMLLDTEIERETEREKKRERETERG